eukprot:TRINITY_DN21832_c0_g1_i1.p1 TRINITY_DN21832_c0_g1~~TRINITY_DN21832_c0_g1_i1.p1  ORF type:complete len:239 (-),score=54.22 TRINITY_DN21832_c0_g1_i1:135-806(-)
MGHLHSKSKPHFLDPVQNDEHIARLKQCDVQALRDIFDKHSGDDGTISEEQFVACLEEAQKDCISNLCETHSLFPRRLFRIFDVNKDGRVDQQEFLAGLAVIVTGTTEEKLKITFQEYVGAHPKKPVITRADLFQVLRKAYLRSLDIIEASDEVDPEDLVKRRKHCISEVRQLVDEAFVKVDVNHDGSISFEEFAEWAKTQPVIRATVQNLAGDDIQGVSSIV